MIFDFCPESTLQKEEKLQQPGLDSETHNILKYWSEKLGISERDLLATSLKAQMAQIDVLLNNPELRGVLVSRREEIFPDLHLGSEIDILLLSPAFTRAIEHLEKPKRHMPSFQEASGLLRRLAEKL